MRARERRTLKRVFVRPAPADIPWDDLESMLSGAGVEVQARSGARVALLKDGEAMVVRRPHPKPLALRATVRDIAAFLRAVGVKP